MLSSKRLFNFFVFILNNLNPAVEYLILLTSRKFISDDALTPKFIASVTSFAIPETATATNSPSSLTIGPPLLPGFSAASI